MALLPDLNHCTLAVIGLGYVGLPLAVEFSTPRTCVRTGIPLKRRVIGFDINSQRLDELRQGSIAPTKPAMQSCRQLCIWRFTVIQRSWQAPMCLW